MQKRANEKKPAQSTGRRGRSLPAALCGVVGRMILLLVILACLPVPAARLCGYEIYDVISGSMEPAIPVGSAVFVRSVSPMQLAPQDVIAFRSHDTVVTHRVVENNALESSLVTQGDANARPDPEPVPYSNVIGRVERSVPGLGWLLSSYTGGSGRLYLICFAAAGALLSLIPALTGSRRKETRDAPQKDAPQEGAPQEDAPQENAGQENAPQEGAPQEDAPQETAGQAEADASPQAAPAPAKRSGAERARRVLMILLALVFAGSAGGYALMRWRAQEQRQTYTDLAGQYVVPDAVQMQDAPDANSPPITVDFDALQAINPDIIGWIYCEDSPINYPVLYGETNDTYLRHDYEKKYNVAGSIFVDVNNNADFSDVNTIVYGHHMDDETMFATLENWQEQAFFDAHPVLWLFTPQQTCRLLPFSAYDTNAYSETYTIFSGPCVQMDEYLVMSAGLSAVQTDIVPDGANRHVLLSTCASAFGSGDNRSVLHCVLEPAA